MAAPARPWSGPQHRLLEPEPLLEGLDGWVHRWMGRWARRPILARELHRMARVGHALQEDTRMLDDAALQALQQEVGEALLRDPIHARGRLVQALCLAATLCERALGLRPYPVQFMGALALHHGHLAEMATGEGKTLTVGLAAVLAGWSGRPCHVVTANDYLAERDAQTLAPLFAAAGLTVGSVHAGVPVEQRRRAYDADVVYVTPKELLADHLRDELARASGTPPALIRGLHGAIVDEADSVFIDEAVTPLIISARRPARGLDVAVRLISAWAEEMQAEEDYLVMPRQRDVRLLPRAQRTLAARAAELPELWRPAERREELLRQALQVRWCFRRGLQYLVHEGEVVLLDEFTGRMTPGRTLTAGLHQAIEAFEGLEITEANESISQMSFQAFFRSFARLAGCSGTAWEAADEIWRVYQLRVVRIPTHRPRLARSRPPVWRRDEAKKWAEVARQVLQLQAAGRAVLVGVRSVKSSQMLADTLRERGLEVSVLNAEAHAEEASLVALAGTPGRVTIATNMAGRGTDIPLDEAVARAGGLHVVVAEVNDSARVDRQLAGRCGRQGDPGSISTVVCAQDLLVQRYWPRSFTAAMTGLQARWPRLAPRILGWAVAWAQARCEADAFARRLSVLKSDDWMASALPFRGPGQERTR